MTRPDDSVRKIIEEAIAPRLAGHSTYLANARPDALSVARADLLYLWDDYRTEYLDWATLGHPVGHSHPLVRNAAAEQLSYYGHTAPAGEHIQRWPVEYAQALSECFTAQGQDPRQVLWAEGEQAALRMAFRLAGERRIAVLDTGWHDWLLPDPRIDDWTRFERKNVPWGEYDALLLATIDIQGHPVPVTDLQSWITAAREHQVTVIADETITGFGRTGTLWGMEHTGRVPDVTVLGGAVGGGYPLGAVIADPRYFAGEPLNVGGQAGNPAACAAGEATLRAVTLGVLEYLAETIPLLTKGLDQIVTQFPEVLDGHHGTGMVRGLRFHDYEQAVAFPARARAQGLYLAPATGSVVLLAPALITSTNEVTRGVDLLAAALMD
jgi:4-aminobutyrate aminotransferase-like enzyme